MVDTRQWFCQSVTSFLSIADLSNSNGHCEGEGDLIKCSNQTHCGNSFLKDRRTKINLHGIVEPEAFNIPRRVYLTLCIETQKAKPARTLLARVHEWDLNHNSKGGGDGMRFSKAEFLS